MADKTRIFLSPPHLGGQEIALINQAFESNWIAPIGPHISAFEQEICLYTGSHGALAVNSGTAAIHLALRVLGVSSGDIVFCSTLTFIGSVNPVLYQNARPVFIDSEPESWNMSPLALKKAFDWAVEQGVLPKAVIVVNLYGHSADMDALLSICNYYKVPLIEDAAESLGATYKGKFSGTLGKYGIYSFNGNKIITTSGGGMLVSDDIEGIKYALYLATQARDTAPFYQHSEIGYNYRMSNILAAIGRGQLNVLPDRITKRRSVFQYYYNNLKDIKGLGFIPECQYGISNRWLTVLTINPKDLEIDPVVMIDYLEKENIECRRVWKPMHLQPIFKNCPYFPHKEGDSTSDILFQTGLCIPSGSNLTEEQQNRVIESIRRLIK